jgi:PAS domain S-box-containing protein
MLQSLSAAIGVDVESRELKTQLYQRNEVYETSLSTLNELLWEIDLRKKKIRIMGSSSNIGGLRVGEYDLEPVEWMKSHVHPEDRDRVVKHFNEFLLKEHKAQDEDVYRSLANEGDEYVWIRSRRTLIRDINGEAAIVVGTTTDITDSKIAALELEKQREQLRHLINNIDDVYAIYDLKANRYEFVSDNVETFFGTSKQEFIEKGLFWRDIIHIEDTEGIRKQMEDVIHNKGRGEFFYRITTPTGESKMLLEKITVGSKDNEDPDKVYIVITDYTTIENAEQSLIESERKFRFISDNISDFISVHSIDGYFTYASPSAMNLFGYDAEELLGMNVVELIHAEDKGFFIAEVNKTVKDRTEAQVTYRLQNQKGKYIWVESYCKPILNAKRETSSIICSTRDVTERRNLMQELEQALEKERELNELRSKFVSTASHEFRTPLTVIQSGVEIMEMYLENLPEEKQKPFQRQFFKIQTEVARLQDLMNDVLLLGRADADRTPFQPQQHDLLSFINEIIENYNAPIFKGRQVTVQVFGEPVPVEFDEKLLGHALDNIISNGFRYSNEGNLELKAIFNNENVLISVTDYGIGIPQEDLANLFQPFYRAGNTGEIDGTGLGLSIVKEYIAKHNGQVSVESELNKQTTFTITLPLKQNTNGAEAKNIGD